MANKIYTAPETPLVFKGSGGDAVITLANLGFGAGRISARYDRGTGSKPRLYKWRGVVQWEDNPVAGEAAEILLAESDGTIVDGVVGVADAALTAGQRTNLGIMGIVRAQAATGSVDNVASSYVLISERYFSVGVWNASAAKNLKNTANVSYVILTPVPDEIQ